MQLTLNRRHRSFCLLLAASLLQATAPARANPCIFSLSQAPQTSTLLGAVGVSAYIQQHGKKKRRGFYITQVTASGDWQLIGLRPGDMLMSIGKDAVVDAQSADQAIKHNVLQQQKILFVRPTADGTPDFITVKMSLPSAGTDGTPPPSVAPLPSASPSPTTDADPDSIPALEAYAGDLINSDRQREGSAPICMNSALSQLARDYAQYLIKHGTFAHIDLEGRNPQMRAREHGIQCGVYENLSYRTFGVDSQREMISRCEAQMMAEPKGQQNHRSNIVKASHCCMGVGIARDAKRLVMVHEFTDTPP